MKVPLSVLVATFGWLVATGFFLWMTYGVAVERTCSAVVLWFFVTSLCLSGLLGFHTRSICGWYWSRFVSAVLGWFSSVPLIFGIGLIVYVALGGKVEDQMVFVTRVMMMIGVICALPVLTFGVTYFAMGAKSARKYIRICPECFDRIQAPVDVIFGDYQCDKCRFSLIQSDRFKV